jgi:uncharacterized damage-inducible protein DinB
MVDGGWHFVFHHPPSTIHLYIHGAIVPPRPARRMKRVSTGPGRPAPITPPTQGTSMKGQDAIRTALQTTSHLLNWYVEDLSDADLLMRPAPGANHIAWQLGHLVGAESHLGGMIGFSYPALPAGFAEQHGKETAQQDPPKGFSAKKQYLELFNQRRQATIDQLGKLSEADLDRPTEGNMAKFAPTHGALLLLLANHTTMHSGQFSVVRRKLGKPVLF